MSEVKIALLTNPPRQVGAALARVKLDSLAIQAMPLSLAQVWEARAAEKTHSQKQK